MPVEAVSDQTHYVEFGWQPPTKQESRLVRVGVPWVYPWGDVKLNKCEDFGTI
jgi:hypothetical protein